MYITFIKDNSELYAVSTNADLPSKDDTVQIEGEVYAVASRMFIPEENSCIITLGCKVRTRKNTYEKAKEEYEKRGTWPDVPEDVFLQMSELLRSGCKLQAVKLIKESLNIGLKEAKDFVDICYEFRIYEQE